MIYLLQKYQIKQRLKSGRNEVNVRSGQWKHLELITNNAHAALCTARAITRFKINVLASAQVVSLGTLTNNVVKLLKSWFLL